MAKSEIDKPTMTPTEIRELKAEAYRGSLESQAVRIYIEQVFDDPQTAWQEVGAMSNEKIRQFVVDHGELPEEEA